MYITVKIIISTLFLIPQTLQEPEGDGDGDVVQAEYGGHKVLTVMRPPIQQLHFYGHVSLNFNTHK